jgi:hypothetical protein
VFLKRQQLNLLFRAVQESGFDPRDFEVEHADGWWKLTHCASGDWFAIELESHAPHAGDGSWLVRIERVPHPAKLRVTHQIGDEEPQTTHFDDVEGVLPALDTWLKDSEAEHETPDLWAELGKDEPIAELMEGQENTPFTEQEQERIAAVVAEVLAQAKETYELPEEELWLLEAKLDYLVDAARHTRRIDWLNTAVGAIAGAFAGGVLTPDVVQKVLGALGAGLGPLFGHPVPMLGP